MSMCSCSFQLRQSLDPSTFGAESALPKASRIIDDNPVLAKELDRCAKAERYRSGMDYVLCKLFPAFRRDCLAYYRGAGESLLSMLGKHKCNKIDTLICEATLLPANNYIKSLCSDASCEQLKEA